MFGCPQSVFSSPPSAVKTFHATVLWLNSVPRCRVSGLDMIDMIFLLLTATLFYFTLLRLV